jgi:pilus assembly protein CpaB
VTRRNTGGRIRALLFLGLSGAAATVASLVIFLLLRSFQGQLDDAIEHDQVVRVIVAKQDVWQGETIGVEDLAMVELPLDYVPDTVLRSSGQAVGRVPRERILAHEFIREERLSDPEGGVGLNALIPHGMRAMSINVSDGSALSGFLNPGNYVDVLVTLDGDDSHPAETRTLMQAVTLLAVDRRLGQAGEGGERARPSVTLALTPDLAETLTHAMEQGMVTLTLRSDIDVTRVETHGAVVDDFLSTEENRITVERWSAQRKENPDPGLTIIHGDDVEVER